MHHSLPSERGIGVAEKGYGLMGSLGRPHWCPSAASYRRSSTALFDSVFVFGGGWESGGKVNMRVICYVEFVVTKYAAIS